MTNISLSAVQQFTREPSAQMRGQLASKLLADYRSGSFSAAESSIAEEIFRLLSRDVETRIRASLATELAKCKNVPNDIILSLANDETHVCLPILEFSHVLTEEELITIVKSTREVAKHCAIARRDTISQDLAKTLIETSDTLVLHTLFSNKGAMLNEENMLPYWQDIPFTQPLLEALVKRGSLPVAIVEKLYYAVSNDLKSHLSKLYPHHSPSIAKVAQDVREWELLGITPQENTVGYDEDMAEDFIDDMALRNRLTPSLLMRALCIGNLAVFEMGIARLAGVPRVNARILLMEASGKGLAAIYNSAKMPEGFLEAISVLLKISLEESEFGRFKHSDFRKRVIDRIYQERYNITIANMEYVLSIIGGQMTPAYVH